MSTDDPRPQESIASADSEQCDECAALPEGWPCADCFIAGDKEIRESGQSDETRREFLGAVVGTSLLSWYDLDGTESSVVSSEFGQRTGRLPKYQVTVRVELPPEIEAVARERYRSARATSPRSESLIPEEYLLDHVELQFEFELAES